jgi:hypothetical protein
MLAEAVIADGGVVFGVRFAEDWSVEHGYAETKEALAAFRGSKYVQSRVRTAYADVLRFLKAGRKVLFSGTSCQIAGLYRFLRKDYENLLTVEVVCHGVPSPMLWQSYLAYLKKNAQHAFDAKSLAPSEVFEPQIVDVNFRNKKVGWQRYGFSLRMQSVSSVERKISSRSVADNVKSQGNVSLFEESSKNLYMRLFLSDMCLRPSCYACKAKAGASHADIALADFWNINKRYADWNDDRGASLVLVYTARGVEAFRRVKSNCLPTDYDFARSCNRAVEVCAAETKYVGKFWKEFQRKGWKNISSLIERSVPLKLRFDLWKMRMKQRLPLSLRQKLGLK